MSRALELAERGLFSTHPNPRVGCVIVKQGKIVGEGWHERAGGPHAEIVALESAGGRARGADVYVTLEPCAHHGRTPPCCKALVAAGVKRVHAAMEDPNPLVAGKGLERLREAGIEVRTGEMEAEARNLNRGFVSRMTRRRPWVTLKLAASLDGRTAAADGESRWITSEAARADVHHLRAAAGAVLTGIETVLADDPELTVRLPPPASRLPIRQPDRIVLDTHLRAPADARVWAEGARRLALTVRPPADHAERLRELGVDVVLCSISTEGYVDLASALERLAEREVNEVLIECGPKLAGSFLRARLVDELVLYLAPSLLGHEARPLAELPGLQSLGQRIALEFADARRVGDDLRLTLHPKSRRP